MTPHARQVLLILGFGTALLAGLPMAKILPKPRRWFFVGVFVLEVIWYFASVMNYPGGLDFWGWFLDATAEHNISAMWMSSELMVIGWVALMLVLWPGALRRFYWAILAALFIFLSLDEYYAIHESIDFWREGYMLVGGAVLVMSAVMFWYGSPAQRLYRAGFIFGFGIMGFAGVFLDAFSNGHTVGPIPITCTTSGFLGVPCQRYGIYEELLELLGGAIMLFSVFSLAIFRAGEARWPLVRRAAVGVGVFWFVGVLTLGFWVWPTVAGHLFAKPMRADYLDGRLSLVRGHIKQGSLHPGDYVDVTLYVRVNDFLPENYGMSVGLVAQDLAHPFSIGHGDIELGNFEYPTSAWIPGLLVRNKFRFTILEDTPAPASYRVVTNLWIDHYNNAPPVEYHGDMALFDAARVVLADIPVFPVEPPPPPPVTLGFHIEGGFSLVGYDLPAQMAAGETVDVRFWWSVEEDGDVYHTHFLHFVPETGEPIVFNQQPFGGLFPTGTWPAGMYAVDTWHLTIPADMPPGVYRVQTGMFSTDTGVRTPMTGDDETRVQDMSAVLGRVTITAP